MSDAALRQIQAQLDLLLRLAALLLVDGQARLSDKVDRLHRAGLPPKLIAELTGTTANTVRVQLSRQRALSRGKASATRSHEHESGH